MYYRYMVTQSQKSQSFPSSGIKASGIHVKKNEMGALAQTETNGDGSGVGWIWLRLTLNLVCYPGCPQLIAI